MLLLPLSLWADLGLTRRIPSPFRLPLIPSRSVSVSSRPLPLVPSHLVLFRSVPSCRVASHPVLSRRVLCLRLVCSCLRCFFFASQAAGSRRSLRGRRSVRQGSRVRGDEQALDEQFCHPDARHTRTYHQGLWASAFVCGYRVYVALFRIRVTASLEHPSLSRLT